KKVNVNSPVGFERVEVVAPVSALVRLTGAEGIAAPVGSVTVPYMVAVVTWAWAAPPQRISNPMATWLRRLRCLISFPFIFRVPKLPPSPQDNIQHRTDKPPPGMTLCGNWFCRLIALLSWVAISRLKFFLVPERSPASGTCFQGYEIEREKDALAGSLNKKCLTEAIDGSF